MDWKQWTTKTYQDYFVFPTNAKSKPSAFIDKQASQEVKTTCGVATQLKREVSFKFRLHYIWRIHSCWSLYMRLGILGAVSGTLMTVTGFEFPDRKAAHAGGVPGSISSPAALGHFECFGFPLSLPFHEYSIPVNSLVTDAILLRNSQRRANNNCDILVYYSASSVDLLTTFQGNPFVPSFLPVKMGPIGCSETLY
jgi:hypothetical protein